MCSSRMLLLNLPFIWVPNIFCREIRNWKNAKKYKKSFKTYVQYIRYMHETQFHFDLFLLECLKMILTIYDTVNVLFNDTLCTQRLRNLVSFINMMICISSDDTKLKFIFVISVFAYGYNSNMIKLILIILRTYFFLEISTTTIYNNEYEELAVMSFL